MPFYEKVFEVALGILPATVQVEKKSEKNSCVQNVFCHSFPMNEIKLSDQELNEIRVALLVASDRLKYCGFGDEYTKTEQDKLNVLTELLYDRQREFRLKLMSAS